MTTVGVSIANNEFDAAQALLDLQSNVRENIPDQRDTKSLLDCKEDMEKSATYILSCFLKPIPAEPSVQTVEKMAIAAPNSGAKDLRIKRTPKRKLNSNHDYLYGSRADNYSEIRSNIFERNPKDYTTQTSVVKNTQTGQSQQRIVNKLEIKTNSRDMGTQTEEKYELTIVKTMERTIEKLYERIHSLEEQIRVNAKVINSIEQGVSDDDHDLPDVDDVSYESKADNHNIITLDDSHIPDSDEDEEISYFGAKVKDNDPDFRLEQESKSKKVLRNSNTNVNANDMIPIGDGNATIPSRIYRHINWNSYTSATRKLLTAVFSRKVLATHSLTGKPSPAFPNKPAKKKLDSLLVNDIVQAVVENCNVPENVVRTSITTKCADESKMFRTRQKNKKKLKYKQYSENIPPGSESDDV